MWFQRSPAAKPKALLQTTSTSAQGAASPTTSHSSATAAPQDLAQILTTLTVSNRERDEDAARSACVGLVGSATVPSEGDDKPHPWTSGGSHDQWICDFVSYYIDIEDRATLSGSNLTRSPCDQYGCYDTASAFPESVYGYGCSISDHYLVVLGLRKITSQTSAHDRDELAAFVREILAQHH